MPAQWPTATVLPLLFAVVACAVLEIRQVVQLKAFSESDDRGTGELRFDVSGQDGLYSGCISLARPIDSGVQAVTEVSRWMDRTKEWGRTFHVHRMLDACAGTLALMPSFARSIANCMGIEGGCPLPAGEYHVHECELTLGNITRRLPAGDFRLAVSLRNATHLLGRFYMVVGVSACKLE